MSQHKVYTNLVALLDHHFLSQKDLFCRNLHAQVSSGNHDSVRCLQDVIKVLNTLLVLDFADDLDLPAFRTQHLQCNITPCIASIDVSRLAVGYRCNALPEI